MRITNFLGTCVSREISELAEKKGKKFSHNKAKKLIKEFSPEMYKDLNLDLITYYEGDTNIKNGKILHIIHSATDYLFSVER